MFDLITHSALAALTATSAAAQASGEVDHTFWYLSRAAGLCAYAMLVANMALGIALSVPILERFVLKWRIFDLHQFTGLFFVALLLLHVLALLGDKFLGYTLPQLLVPFDSPYRAVDVAIGVLAFYLTLVVTFTFYVRQQIGQRTWRLIHYGSFAAFVMSLLHSVLAGTDTRTGWAKALYTLTGLAIGGLTLWRFSAGRAATARPSARRPQGEGRPTWTHGQSAPAGRRT